MVVAARPAHLAERRVDALADLLHLAKIERRPLDEQDAPVGDHLVVRRRVLLRENAKLLVKHGTGAEAFEIEVGMLGRVADRVPVRLRLIRDDELILIRKRIRHGDLQVAGIAALARRAHVGEPQGAVLLLRRPDLLVVAAQGAAVQMIPALVALQDILLVLNGQIAERDAPRRASDDRAEVLVVRLVALEILVAERHVDALAFPVRHEDRLHARAVIHDGQLHAAAVLQCVKRDAPAVRQLAKCFFRDLRHLQHLSLKTKGITFRGDS